MIEEKIHLNENSMIPIIEDSDNEIFISKSNKNNECDDSLKNEINLYLNLQVEKKDCLDSLKWWNDNKKCFPNLSELARSILMIASSSAESERLFSTTGKTMFNLIFNFLLLVLEKVFINKSNFF